MISKFYYLQKKDIEEICHRLAVMFFDRQAEPIPPYSDCDDALLESALGNPQQIFSGKELYPNLIDKAAILFYSLIKNHAFRNGNKRIASVSLYVFLWINDHILVAEDQSLDLAKLALKISDSKPDDRKALIIETTTWINAHMRHRSQEEFFTTGFFPLPK